MHPAMMDDRITASGSRTHQQKRPDVTHHVLANPARWPSRMPGCAHIYQRICSILAHLHGVRHIQQQKSSKTQGKQTNLLPLGGEANPFKKQWKINISIEKCAADGSHSRPSPGLRQGPGSSDLHFLGLNLKVVGKQYPA